MVNQHKDEGLLSKKWALTLTIMIYNKSLPKQNAAEKICGNCSTQLFHSHSSRHWFTIFSLVIADVFK